MSLAVEKTRGNHPHRMQMFDVSKICLLVIPSYARKVILVSSSTQLSHAPGLGSNCVKFGCQKYFLKIGCHMKWNPIEKGYLHSSSWFNWAQSSLKYGPSQVWQVKICLMLRFQDSIYTYPSWTLGQIPVQPWQLKMEACKWRFPRFPIEKPFKNPSIFRKFHGNVLKQHSLRVFFKKQHPFPASSRKALGPYHPQGHIHTLEN